MRLDCSDCPPAVVGGRTSRISPMSSRAIAFFLALVLSWSGLATQERATAFAPIAAEEVVVVPADHGPERLQDGSVEHHHLDDVPSQVQLQSLADLPALLMAGTELPVPTSLVAWPRPHAASSRLSPYPERLERPPRTTSRIV